MVFIKYFSVLKSPFVAAPYSFFVCKSLKNQGIAGAAVCVPVRFSFYESSRKGAIRYEEESKITPLERIPHGYSVLKNEVKLWLQEVEQKFRSDPKFFKHGDTDVLFRFDSEESLKKWQTVSDMTHNEGFSHCQLQPRNDGKAVFSGVVDTTLPRDGKIKRAGYCVMKSKDKKKSFLRADSFDWSSFTHLEMRVRGDGRNYIIGLKTSAYFDIQWFDLYTYALHTRGGPYWQTAKIPFSKFFLSSKGTIQDKQQAFRKNKINSILIMCAKVPGPFKLEIDYIGVHRDDLNFEEFAYELYRYPKNMVSS